MSKREREGEREREREGREREREREVTKKNHENQAKNERQQSKTNTPKHHQTCNDYFTQFPHPLPSPSLVSIASNHVMYTSLPPNHCLYCKSST